jgi:hypothetical protein
MLQNSSPFFLSSPLFFVLPSRFHCSYYIYAAIEADACTPGMCVQNQAIAGLLLLHFISLVLSDSYPISLLQAFTPADIFPSFYLSTYHSELLVSHIVHV